MNSQNYNASLMIWGHLHTDQSNFSIIPVGRGMRINGREDGEECVFFSFLSFFYTDLCLGYSTASINRSIYEWPSVQYLNKY